jgi:hypothetical protein
MYRPCSWCHGQCHLLRVHMCNLRFRAKTVINNAVLEKDVVSRKRESPGSRRGCHQRHWDAETNFGSHVWRRYREVIDHLIVKWMRDWKLVGGQVELRRAPRHNSRSETKA